MEPEKTDNMKLGESNTKPEKGNNSNNTERAKTDKTETEKSDDLNEKK